MSKISNAVFAALSATATGSGGGGICSVSGDLLIGDFQIAAFHSLGWYWFGPNNVNSHRPVVT